ncbi:MAG: hypothetical protein Q7R45_05750, partial [Sulfuricaulis sp.]|nr:hypothetical protein [Sulfuricaulis sp.]
ACAYYPDVGAALRAGHGAEVVRAAEARVEKALRSRIRDKKRPDAMLSPLWAWGRARLFLAAGQKPLAVIGLSNTSKSHIERVITKRRTVAEAPGKLAAKVGGLRTQRVVARRRTGGGRSALGVLRLLSDPVLHQVNPQTVPPVVLSAGRPADIARNYAPARVAVRAATTTLREVMPRNLYHAIWAYRRRYPKASKAGKPADRKPRTNSQIVGLLDKLERRRVNWRLISAKDLCVETEGELFKRPHHASMEAAFAEVLGSAERAKTLLERRHNHNLPKSEFTVYKLACDLKKAGVDLAQVSDTALFRSTFDAIVSAWRGR